MVKQITVIGIIPAQNTPQNCPIADRFWNYVKDNINNNEETKNFNKTEFEQRLRQSFGRNLKEQITHYFHDSWYGNNSSSLNNVDIKALAGFFFEVSEINYSSLELKLNILGVEKLAELFDNNVQLFKAVVKYYIPAAFQATIPINSGFIDWQLGEDVKTVFLEILTEKKQDSTNTIFLDWNTAKKPLTVSSIVTGLLIYSGLLIFIWDDTISSKVDAKVSDIKAELKSDCDIRESEMQVAKQWLDQEKKRLDRERNDLYELIKKGVAQETKESGTSTNTQQSSTP